MQTQTQPNSQKSFTNISPAMTKCIQSCNDCYEICTQMITHCLDKGGKHADPKHIQLLFDCAQICNLSSNFMIRNSGSHSIICDACAEICEACAVSCETLASSDSDMKKIVDACRQCTASCSEMAKMQ